MKKIVEDLFERADICIGGDRPWDIHVHDERFFDRLASGGAMALGESYMDGWWTSPSIDQFVCKIFLGRINAKIIPFSHKLLLLKSKLINRQTLRKAHEVAEHHYELDADLFMSFLDPYNQYTCGYFQDTDDLNIAQEQKLDLICRKLQLQPQDRVLDIGCGWGGFAKFAAEHYGCHVTGITIAEEQLQYARKFCAGLPVDIVKSDYRDHKGTYDKVMVCGMIEAVGHKNYREFMEAVQQNLKDGGLFLLHTIGRHRAGNSTDPWIDKYIFRNGMVPSATQLTAAAERLFALNDWHSFGSYYDPTLMAWQQNFERSWPQLKDRYDERFYRMWNYYLLSCAGSFRANKKQLWQIVYAKRRGAVAGYRSVR